MKGPTTFRKATAANFRNLPFGRDFLPGALIETIYGFPAARALWYKMSRGMFNITRGGFSMGVNQRENHMVGRVVACLIAVACVWAVLVTPGTAGAAWSDDADNPIMVNDLYYTDNCRPQAVADGRGGVIVVWHVFEPVEGIFAQKYNKYGNPTWTTSVYGDYAYFTEAVTDGRGGVIVSWTDGSDFYCQRVDKDGNIQWGNNGILVLEDTDEAWLAPDGSGGAYLFDYDNAVVARVASDGSLAWDEPVQVSDQSIWANKIVYDRKGGAIMVWKEQVWDEEAGDGGDWVDAVMVQRVDANGELLWNSGAPLLVAKNGDCPRITATGEGGAIVTWIGDDDCLYGQKIEADGEMAWDEDGVFVDDLILGGSYPEPASDGEGGAFVPYGRLNEGYVAHILNDGITINYTRFTEDYGWVHNHPRHTVEDGNGGVITAWFEETDGGDNLLIQRFDKNLVPLWDEGGTVLAYDTPARYGPRVALSLDSNKGGGVAVAWVADRITKAIDKDVYIQYIGLDGTLGKFTPGREEEAEEDYSEYIKSKEDSDGRNECFIGAAATGQGSGLAAMLAALIVAGASLIRRRRDS